MEDRMELLRRSLYTLLLLLVKLPTFAMRVCVLKFRCDNLVWHVCVHTYIQEFARGPAGFQAGTTRGRYVYLCVCVCARARVRVCVLNPFWT